MKRQFKRIIGICLFVLGFSSIFTQIYFIREFITLFKGNEMVLGITLASWMLLTGFGAWLGRFFSRMKGRLAFVFFLQLLLTLLPVVTIIKMDLWRNLLFSPGVAASMTDIIYASLLFQLPFCIINGFLFIAYSTMLSSYSGQNETGHSYALESIGAVTGGMVVNLILLWFLGTFKSLFILMIIDLIMISVFITLFNKIVFRIFLMICLLVATVVFYRLDLQRITRAWSFPDQKVVYSRSNPYGEIVVTEKSGQFNFYENGLLLFSSNNEIFNEEAVHYAMIQHPKPEKVLLISGGITGMINEVLKYHPVQIDYYELNPAIVEFGQKFINSLTDSMIRLHIADARNNLRKNRSKFDVVLINLPEPSTLQINRYYTSEFFAELKTHLNPGAVISLSLATTADYVSETAAKLNSSLFASLKSEFRQVLIIPGLKNYLLASDSALSLDITNLINDKEIQTVYVNYYYLDDNLMKDRNAFIMKHLTVKPEMNRDFKPVACFYQLQYWSSFFKTNYLVIIAGLLIFLILIILNLNSTSYGLFTGGFSASSIQILILLSFQIMNGYLFSTIGIMIMMFMAGLALGVKIQPRFFPVVSVRNYIHVQITIAVYTLVFPFLILMMNAVSMSGWLNFVFLGLLNLLIAILAGIEFALATQVQKQNTSNLAAKNYSADLFGSAFGAILTTLLFLPFLGLVNTCLVLVALNLSSALVIYLYRNKLR
jgi:spermidine synthase